ncbi:MAG: hypothetical protein HYZ23_00575 [Chloroflexi bacterium]|nr:hypothetical protein [Chloroflexota bacterium]
MKPLNKPGSLIVRPEIVLLKRKFGMFYGMITGLAFAISAWGWDGYLLHKSHAYFPWTILITGAICCLIFSGIAGWLTAWSQNSLFGVLFWLGSSLLFAWLVVALPLQINPFIASKLDPQLGALMKREVSVGFGARFGVSLAWILPFMLIVGVAQLPVTETAAFSTSIFGRISPFFFGVVVMSVSGMILDDLINVRFRTAISTLDDTIQFVLDNRDNENLDPALSRAMHARALGAVEEYVQEGRRLFIGDYDETLGDLQVLVKFGGQWINCHVIYNQLSFCKTAAAE